VESMTQSIEALKWEWQAFYATVAKPARCIFCGGTRLWWNGWRHRTASVLVDGRVVHVEEVACRLVKCGLASCGRSWTLRPPGLAPQRHYQLGVVAQAASSYLFDPDATQEQVAVALGCARRTVRRWLGWLAGIASASDLLRHLVEASDVPEIPPLQEVAALAQKACTAARRQVLESAARVLCLLEALGHALCLPPPGLQTVLELVLGGRYRATTDHRPRILEFARRHLDLGGGTLPM
jgi:hypothetical protein